MPLVAQDGKGVQSTRALHYDSDYNDNSEREQRVLGEDRKTQETTTTGVAIMVVCHRMCDYHHEHLEEDERPTTMVTTTGVLAQGQGCHYDTMTGSTAMVTTMQDRLQERSSTKRPTTSWDYVIRLTDRLRMLRSKFYTFFSQRISGLI